MSSGTQGPRKDDASPDGSGGDRFTKLPAELIELIASCLTSTDLLSYRQTCRAMCDNSRRIFGHRFITERPFILYDRPSLDNLAQCVDDPRKREYLDPITLSMAYLVDAEADDRLRRLHAEEAGAIDDREHRARLRDQRRMFEQRKEEERDLRAGGAAEVLANVFERMRGHGINVGVKITTVGFNVFQSVLFGDDPGKGHHEDPPAWGFRRLCRELGYRRCVDKHEYNTYGFQIVFDALYRSRHSPSTLELGNIWHATPVSYFGNIWLRPALAQGDAPFRNLTSLRLFVSLVDHERRYRWWHHDLSRPTKDRDDFLPLFHQAMLGAINIETFSLEISDSSFDADLLGDTPFPTCFVDEENLLLPRLKYLELVSLGIDVRQLASALEERKDTLRELRLRWIKNPEGEVNQDNLPETDKPLEIITSVVNSMPNCTVSDWHCVYDGEPWKNSERHERKRNVCF